MADVALLVDAENIQGTDLSATFHRAASEGRVIIRRAYGNQTVIDNIREPMVELAFEPVVVLNPRKGKNTADIRIVIDAMDLLHTSHVETFVLVTKDSDFASLARRLREQGRRVVGIGDKDTASTHLKQSCDVYHDISDAGTELVVPDPNETPSSRIPQKARELLKEAFRAAVGEDGWVVAAKMGNVVLQLDPSFKPKDYGFVGLRKMVEAMPRTFQTEEWQTDVRIRLAP